MICVEQYDGHTWCESTIQPGDEYVEQHEWHGSPTALMRADCPHCLDAIYTLAEWSHNRLSQLHRQENPAGRTWNPPAPNEESRRKP